jgi:hypothetical protein
MASKIHARLYWSILSRWLAHCWGSPLVRLVFDTVSESFCQGKRQNGSKIKSPGEREWERGVLLVDHQDRLESDQIRLSTCCGPPTSQTTRCRRHILGMVVDSGRHTIGGAERSRWRLRIFRDASKKSLQSSPIACVMKTSPPHHATGRCASYLPTCR